MWKTIYKKDIKMALKHVKNTHIHSEKSRCSDLNICSPPTPHSYVENLMLKAMVLGGDLQEEEIRRENGTSWIDSVLL